MPRCSRGQGGLDEHFGDGLDVAGWQGFGYQGSQHDTALVAIARDQLEDGTWADPHADVTCAARCVGEVAREEVEALAAAFVEDHLAFAVEDEDVGGLEICSQPFAENLDAIEETGRRRGGGSCLGGDGF